jgi:hypothetical protein
MGHQHVGDSGSMFEILVATNSVFHMHILNNILSGIRIEAPNDPLYLR